MSEDQAGFKPQFMATTVASYEKGLGIIEKLLAVTQPGAVFGPPVAAHDQTVLTASEVMIGLGFGYGGGESRGEAEEQNGAGGGGGGGGAATGRPVAVVIIGEGGVHVEPVVDPTKMALALFTTLGAMVMMLSRMRRTAGR